MSLSPNNLEKGGTLSDWNVVAESWSGMRVDNYMADGGTYRRRRYCVSARAQHLTNSSSRLHANIFNRLRATPPTAVQTRPSMEAGSTWQNLSWEFWHRNVWIVALPTNKSSPAKLARGSPLVW